MRRLILAGLVATCSVFGAEAGGSMANDVKVIVVSPSSTHRALSEKRQMLREMKRSERQADRLAEWEYKQLFKEELRRQRDADRAYEKKLAAQRKAAKKGRK